ncbi:MAG: hypothetical protein WC551_13950 [Patescibacteria group bacterium]
MDMYETSRPGGLIEILVEGSFADLSAELRDLNEELLRLTEEKNRLIGLVGDLDIETTFKKAQIVYLKAQIEKIPYPDRVIR